MDSGKRGAWMRGSTGDTANAFHRTLHDMIYIIKKLLDVGFDFVLLDKIQSDRLEGGFGNYRCSSGNCFTTCEQVVNRLSKQRLKLCNKLDIQQSNDLERPSISFIIFWEFLMFYQIFLSPQVKPWTIISYEHGIYELPQDLLNDLRLRKLGNIRKLSKLHRMIVECPVSLPKWKFC